MRSANYRRAEAAVIAIAADKGLRSVAENEPVTSFCPRCGQLPSGDRRMEEAREIFFRDNKKNFKMSDVNFALELSRWLR